MLNKDLRQKLHTDLRQLLKTLDTVAEKRLEANAENCRLKPISENRL